MLPTPRTDALRLKMAQLGWPSDGEPVAMLMASHEQLERELAAEREQVAILRSDERRLSEFAKAYRLRADQAEEQLADCRKWSSKLADVADDLRAKLAAERALADRLANVLTLYNHDLLAGEMIQWVPAHDEALDAWKEARSGTD